MQNEKKEQGPGDTHKPVLLIEKELSRMSYMELVDTFKVHGFKQKEIIRMMAQKLNETIGTRKTKQEIRKMIAHDLKDFVKDDYILKVLGPEYADPRFRAKEPSRQMKKAIREMAKAEGGARSDTKFTIIIPDELMDWIDDERGEDSPQKFIIKKLKELAGLD